MKRLILMAAIMLWATSVVPAQAQYQNGNELFADCFAEASKAFQRAYCSGYVTGAADMLDTFQRSGAIKRYVCFPERSTIGQIVDVAKRYLAEHPADRHLGAASLVLAAMAKAFPCP